MQLILVLEEYGLELIYIQEIQTFTVDTLCRVDIVYTPNPL